MTRRAGRTSAKNPNTVPVSERGPHRVACAVVIVCALVASIVSLGGARTASIPHAAGTRIDLNAATQAELETLPSIGPARAEGILKLRERLGGFRRVSQLERVHGIGPKTVEDVSPYVMIDAE